MNTKKVISYIEKTALKEQKSKKIVNERFNEYLNICNFSLYGINSIDNKKYQIVYNSEIKAYNFKCHDASFTFNLFSNLLKEECTNLRNLEAQQGLSDLQYERMYFLEKQIIQLRSIGYRGQCHNLTKQNADIYHCRAVTGLLVPKNNKVSLYHSWLENDTHAIDLTNDLIFPKQTYNRYVIERINEFTYEELKGYGEVINGYYTLLYLAAEKKLSKSKKSLTNKHKMI